MSHPKSLFRLTAWTMVLAGIIGCSSGVLAEDVESSEQPAVQESVIEAVSDEPSEELSDVEEESEESEESEEVPSQISEEEEPSVYIEPSYEPESEPVEESSELYWEEPSIVEEDPFPWAREPEESYYYYDSSPIEYSEEESVVSETEESDETASDEEIIESFIEEESSESSVTFQETSVDSSELTRKDWEKLKDHLNSEMKLDNKDSKSSDNAVRDIKDSDAAGNDAAVYLVWGLILIGLGVVVVVFILTSTMYVKRNAGSAAASPKMSSTKKSDKK